ncbi:hypothetical protein GQ42DRAFT_164778 [Ramicandelaber brevisporus]|nr:hypothetical protein GQ42DRAFT_164778 [Ramicandelaber brevisporus]
MMRQEHSDASKERRTPPQRRSRRLKEERWRHERNDGRMQREHNANTTRTQCECCGGCISRRIGRWMARVCSRCKLCLPLHRHQQIRTQALANKQPAARQRRSTWWSSERVSEQASGAMKGKRQLDDGGSGMALAEAAAGEPLGKRRRLFGGATAGAVGSLALNMAEPAADSAAMEVDYSSEAARSDVDAPVWMDRLRSSVADLSVDSIGTAQPADNSRSDSGSKKQKKVFIGRLAGCEKCRQRVPGHMMHIVDK